MIKKVKRARKLTGVKKYQPKTPGITQKSIRKANKTRKRSSLELLVYKWLTEDDIKFRKEKVIGRCHVDIFLEPDRVIEINGCYWHRSICCYPERTKENMEIRMKDVKRYAFFRNKGYEVHVFTECDIKDRPEYVREQLRLLSKGL
ncbi:MAG: hypothetical protein ACRYGG_23770 [Janthinobacterium lividum]